MTRRENTAKDTTPSTPKRNCDYMEVMFRLEPYLYVCMYITLSPWIGRLRLVRLYKENVG